MWALGFFSDKDGDWVHDAGEPVGAGNGTACKMKYKGVVHNLPARLTRQKRPMEPNEMVRITLSGIGDLSQESWVTVSVAATGNPAAGYSYRVPVIGASGLVPMPIPPGCDATITAEGPDGQPSSDSRVVTAEEWAAAKAAIPAGAALSTTLAVPPRVRASSCTLSGRRSGARSRTAPSTSRGASEPKSARTGRGGV